MSNFGYRTLGFGSFANRGSAVPITWATTVTSATHNDKIAFYWTGFDTSTPGTSTAVGSVADNTIDGMVGSNSGGTVTIISCVWTNFNNHPSGYFFGITLTESGSANPGQTGWTSFTCNGTTFNKTDAQFNVTRVPSAYQPQTTYDNLYAYTWATSSGGNPFGTTSGTTVDVSMSNA